MQENLVREVSLLYNVNPQLVIKLRSQWKLLSQKLTVTHCPSGSRIIPMPSHSSRAAAAVSKVEIRIIKVETRITKAAPINSRVEAETSRTAINKIRTVAEIKIASAIRTAIKAAVAAAAPAEIVRTIQTVAIWAATAVITSNSSSSAVVAAAVAPVSIVAIVGQWVATTTKASTDVAVGPESSTS